MDFDQYVAARRTRLVEEALVRGRAPDEAEALVDRVLAQHRRDIVRADDPHPILLDALADVLDGRDGTARRTPALLTWLPLALLALVVVLVAGAVLLAVTETDDDDTDDADPRPTPSSTASPTIGRRMPLLIGYDEHQAVSLLAGLGLLSVNRSAASCGPAELVIGSVPPPGAPVEEGDRVVLSTAAGPVGSDCPADRVAAEAEGWRFVRYVSGRGGPPRFAPRVAVVIDDDAPRYLVGREAATLGFGGLGQYFGGFRGFEAVAGDGRYPRLTAGRVVPPVGRCGVDRPLVFGERRALRVTLESYDLGDDDTCAVTVDLYTDARDRIDGVALYRNNPALPLGQPDVVD